ncbi:unnamed protein product [Sphenostylis stenocarpa]|uniref:FBD domain-containing protein n=1 Tax=Sphenostylis stenocarpa TaxID=92480 RepID=A0AA86VIN5_9FABA|nr:unnamed protein product [Sphenostylis stenocarpa]
MENQDFISNLSDDMKIMILSKLCIDEAVRCSILSQKWNGLWKQISHMELNLKRMVKPFTQLLESRKARTIPDFGAIAPPMLKSVSACNTLVYRMIFNTHSDCMSSCRIKHFQKSLAFGDVENWVNILVARNTALKDLSLECVPHCEELTDKFVSEEYIYVPSFTHGVFEFLSSLELTNYTLDSSLPFGKCNQLKKLRMRRIYLDDVTLGGILENCVVLENFSLLESTGFKRLLIVKSTLRVLQLQALCVDDIQLCCDNLEVLFIDSVICPVHNVDISSPNLRTCHSYSNSMYARMLSAETGKSILKTHEFLSRCSGLVGFRMTNIFENVSTLCIDLDLTHMIEACVLSYFLKLCSNLQVIRIALPVFRPRIQGSSSSKHGHYSHFILSLWEWREVCKCIGQKLKSVHIRGFRGRKEEVEVVKYLITRATMMKRITIICTDSKEAAENLLSLPMASANLSINLKLNANNPMDEFAEHQKEFHL